MSFKVDHCVNYSPSGARPSSQQIEIVCSNALYMIGTFALKGAFTNEPESASLVSLLAPFLFVLCIL